MKESKIEVFDNYEFEDVDKAIKVLENEGWEVVEHRLSSTSTSLTSRVFISVLFQREKG